MSVADGSEQQNGRFCIVGLSASDTGGWRDAKGVSNIVKSDRLCVRRLFLFPQRDRSPADMPSGSH